MPYCFSMYDDTVKKFTIGCVCIGTDYAEMSLISLYSLFKSLNEFFVFSEIIEEIKIVTDESGSNFIAFAESIHSNVKVIKPSNWNDFGLPMHSGNYSTYYKFDLFFDLLPNQTLIYLDSDAFVVGKFDLDFLANRISDSGGDSLLMVPSHRPVLEKTGFMNRISPYNYYNAGFMVVTLRKSFCADKLLQHRETYFPKTYETLIWHDQDLINSYFQDCIEALPFRYNVSTGLIKKENFGPNNLNYLVLSEFNDAVIAHASGRILKSKKYYPYKELILTIAKAGLLDDKINDSVKINFTKFISQIEFFDSSTINKFRQFFGRTSECSPYLYKEDLYWKKMSKKFLKHTRHFLQR